MTKENGKAQTGSAIPATDESSVSYSNLPYLENCLPDRQGPFSGATSWLIRSLTLWRTSHRSHSSVPAELGRLPSP